MKVAGSPKQERVSKIKESSASEKMTEPRNLVLGQIKLEDLEQERLEVRKSVEKKSTAKKQVEKKSVSAAKTASDTKAEVKAAEVTEGAEEPKAAIQAAEEPAAAKQEEKETEPKAKTTRTRAAKKEDTKTAVKKEEKAAEPKTKAKTAAKAASEKIVLQMGGREDVIMNSLIDRVKAAYVAEGHKADSIKNIEVYIKVDENMAYYVIDGYASGISLY